jgi:acyl-CoA thioester hydrolase
MARSDFAFFHALRVRWSEVDRQGIVFNGHYLNYFDVAISEYWRALGYPYPQGLAEYAVDTFVVKATLEYRRSAEYDDVIELGVRAARLGRTSLRFVVDVFRGDELLLNGELIYVIGQVTDHSPTPIPEALRQAILAFEATPPEQA